jgi:mRNA interferase YafQ
MLQPFYRKSFAKDIKRVKRRGKDMKKLKTVMSLLVNEKALPIKYRDHYLSGNYHQHKECHIEPDWLLIYKIVDKQIIFERTGSHSDLF